MSEQLTSPTFTRVPFETREIPRTSELIPQMYAALKLCGCWCTEPVWYLPKATAVKCSRCRAIEAYERKYGPALERAEGST